MRGHAEEGQRRATPGCLGYALAIAVSLVTLALGMAVVDAFETGALDDFLVVAIVVVVVGAVPAAAIGTVGALVVHLVTWRTTSQAWAVGAAAAAGLVAGLLVFQGSPGAAVMLGLAAGVGRLAVVPLATARCASETAAVRDEPVSAP